MIAFIRTRAISRLACVALAVLSLPLLAAAAGITPTAAEKRLAASIATEKSPSEAAAIYRGDWSPGLAAALIDEGIARENKDLAATEALYRLGRDVAAGTGDTRTKARAMSELGGLLARKLAFTEAISTLRECLEIQLAAGDEVDRKTEAAETAVALATALANSGQAEDAVAMSAQAVELATASGSEVLLGRAYSVSGSSATHTGNHRAAISFLQKALTIAEKVKSLTGQAAVLNNLGIASRQVFDYDTATWYFQRSLEIKRQQGPNSRIASSLNNLGELALVQEHFDEAEQFFLRALDSVRGPQEDDIRADALINLGLIADNRHDFPKALDYLDQGVAIAEKLHDLQSFAMARLFETSAHLQMKHLTEAQADVDSVRDLTREAGDRRLSMRLTMAQGDIYREQGLTAKARTEYLSAIQDFEAMRLDVAADETVQSSYDDTTRYVYQSLISLEAGAGQIATAFHFSELSKSRVLLDDLLSGRAEMKRLLTPEETRRNDALLDRLSGLNTRLRSARGAERKPVAQQIDQLRLEYSTFRTGVYAAHPELALRRADPEPISLARAAALLPDDHTALISYSAGANAAYAFVILRIAGKPVLRIHELKTNDEKLANRAGQWRRQIASRELGFAALATELYGTLLKPLQADLAGKTRLIICPDGALWQIPFEALQDASGKFAAESYEIFYAPSVTVLDKMHSVSAKRTGPSSMLALGDPGGDLPAAASEVASIAKLYTAGRSRVLTGSAATESALRTSGSQYSVIHIAAHGMYDDAKPLFSYLALAPSPKSGNTPADDGNLEAREIMDLHLMAKLVILSGCETARSSSSGEGVASMSWALFVAGAPATVASLWKVDSGSTSELMTTLHKGLSQGDTPAKALRDAKLALLKNPNYRHPFYWAGFIGIGAGN